MKRVLDITLSLLVLVALSPLLVPVCVAIVLDSGFPVFFRQTRVGKGGREFGMLKFRSMVANATATGPYFTETNDSRITRVGHFIRRASIDELPQIINVLKGDMSLVGPRPERPIFVDQFRKEIPKYMLRHRMKSGITGWAQVNGWRGNTSIEERIKHDLYYIGHWSHSLDVKILALTFIRGFFHRNAY